MGKSRLFWEFTHSHRTAGLADPGERAPCPTARRRRYLPVIDLLRAYFQIETRDDDAQDPREGHRQAAVAGPGARALAPGAPVAARRARRGPAGSGSTRRSGASGRSTASSGCCCGRARYSRSCCVFEDLHWIDAETQALLDSLVESLPTARLLLLVNYRPEYQHAWGGKTYYRQLRLDPLPPESAEELLAPCSGTTPAFEPAQAAADRADRGQPVLPRGERPDAGGDEGAGGRARRLSADAAASQAIQVPATVQAMLAARIDRLPPEDKRLLQAAAVIGKDVPFALLQAIAELPEESLRRAWPVCRPPSSSTRRACFPDLEYTFKHALTHEVAYGEPAPRPAARAPRPDRRGHRAALSRPPDRARRAARPPCLRGEVWEKAVTYLRQAGAQGFRAVGQPGGGRPTSSRR